MDRIGRFALIKEHKEFQYIYKRGKRIHLIGFLLFYLPKKHTFKVGFTASKKVGNAVVRNRLKRRMRALFYQYCESLQDGYYVLVAKNELKDINFNKLETNFATISKKFGLVQE